MKYVTKDNYAELGITGTWLYYWHVTVVAGFVIEECKCEKSEEVCFNLQHPLGLKHFKATDILEAHNA